MGSAAQIWGQRSLAEKATFLEGLCEGLGASNQYKLSDLLCGSSYSSGKNRFCFLVYSNGARDAIAYFDLFYKNKNQTEIPNWAAIAAYNDTACKEDVVTSNLDRMQKRLECLRQSVNMAGNKGVSRDAIRAQDDYCKTLGL